MSRQPSSDAARFIRKSLRSDYCKMNAIVELLVVLKVKIATKL